MSVLRVINFYFLGQFVSKPGQFVSTLVNLFQTSIKSRLKQVDLV